MRLASSDLAGAMLDYYQHSFRPYDQHLKEEMNLNFDHGSVAPGALVPISQHDEQSTRQAPKKRGRPPAAIWKYFTGVGEVNASTKRRPASCNFCTSVIDSRVEALLKHISKDCQKASGDVRREAEAELITRAANHQAAQSAPESKPKPANSKARLGQGHDAAHAGASTESSGLADARQLRLFLLLDLPLSVADSQPFLDFVKALRGKGAVADSAKLRNTVVTEECAKVQTQICKSARVVSSVTVAVSNTVFVGPNLVMGCRLMFPDKSALLLQVMEAPSDLFSPQTLSETIRDTISHFGSDKVAAIVGPEGHNNILPAIQHVTSCEHHTHSLELRCHAQALCDFTATLMSQNWAKAIILEAHKLIMHLAADKELLPVILHALGANTTAASQPLLTESFFSLVPCFTALARLEPAFRLLLQHTSINISNAEIHRMLTSFNFANLGVLLEILEQCNRALLGMENRKVSLADVTRGWLYIARVLEANKLKVPGVFADISESAYVKQVSKFDIDFCRLALFLDPRYKHAADIGGRFPKLLQKACEIMKKRGHGKEEAQQLISQLQAYKAGMAPYDLPGAWEQFNLQAWWLSLMSPATTGLVGLALLTIEISPFSAYPSQILAAMGWFPRPPRESMQGPFGSKLAILKSYYENEGSSSFSESERVIRPDIGGKATHKAWEFPPAHIGTEELATVLQQWKTRSSDGRLSSGSPGGIFAAWEGIDVHSPLLDPSYTPQINPLPQAIGGLGSFTDNDFDAAQLVQQYTMGQP